MSQDLPSNPGSGRASRGKPFTRELLLSLLRDECAEAARADSIPELLNELFDVIGYIEVYYSSRAPSEFERSELEGNILAAALRHQSKLVGRGLPPLVRTPLVLSALAREPRKTVSLHLPLIPYNRD